MLIDLQLHSTYSDGYLSPTNLAKFIAKGGVKIVALTDHNTVSGQDEFRRACRAYNLKSITGLELYVKLNGRKLNLLWYNFDDKSPLLHELLAESQIRRRRQVRLVLRKLKDLGFNVNVSRILDKYIDYVPVNHIVDEFYGDKKNMPRIKKELNLKNPREGDIISHYFRNKNIGILQESYINLDRIIKLRKKIGGQLILNHPGKYYQIDIDFFLRMKAAGIDGFELLSPHHSIGTIMYLENIAREFNFIATGGSDFHRFEGRKLLVQNSWEYFKIDTKYLGGIHKIIG